jgi:hypothetical protein
MDKNKVRETKQNAHKSQLPISLLSFQNAVLDLAFMLVTGWSALVEDRGLLTCLFTG